VVSRFRPDAVIVTRIWNSSEYIRLLRQYGRLVVVVDDAGPAAKEADLAFAVHWVPNPAPGAITDPRYLALRSEFAELHRRPRLSRRALSEIMVLQGGSDTYGFTPKIVRALRRVPGDFRLSVVVGPAYRHHAGLSRAVAALRRPVEVLRNPDNLASRMAHADLAITAGGNAMYELACVGTPSIVVSGERLDVPSAADLAHRGAAINLGFGTDVSEQAIAEAVNRLASRPDWRRRMGKCGKRVVDGRGAERIVRLVLRRLTAYAGARASAGRVASRGGART
jgi:spore coat polysaccharide biosynthesis predicted glycosyltransferase SpsG